ARSRVAALVGPRVPRGGAGRGGAVRRALAPGAPSRHGDPGGGAHVARAPRAARSAHAVRAAGAPRPREPRGEAQAHGALRAGADRAVLKGTAGFAALAPPCDDSV